MEAVEPTLLCRSRDLRAELLTDRENELADPRNIVEPETPAASCAAENRRQPSQPKISVVIPALNEEVRLPAAIRSAQQAPRVEVIVVDGGSSDGTRAVALQSGARLVDASPGRAVQMNAGAAVAQGEVLLFLHADTRLPSGYEEDIARIVSFRRNLAGAFRLAFDRRTPSLRLIETVANLRSRWLQMPYGDQGLFLKRRTFCEMGGFQELPIMEDYEFVLRLRRKGRVAIAAAAAITSARRYARVGPWRTVLRHWRSILAWHARLRRPHSRAQSAGGAPRGASREIDPRQTTKRPGQRISLAG